MDWHSIWQGMATNWLSYLLIFGATIVLAWLKKKESGWLGPALYGLAGFALMSIIVFTFTGRAILSTETPHTTSDNIESNIKVWADRLSLGIQKQTDANFSFIYAVTVHSGRGVSVARSKEIEGYLQFQGHVALGPEHEAALKKLSPPQLERVLDEINLEMARGKSGFSIDLLGPSKGIAVIKTVPITSGLTEDSFISSLDEIDTSILLAREAIKMAFAHSGVG